MATIGPGGHPHTSAQWFAWDGTALWLNSLVRSQRWTDLTRDPRVSVIVDDGGTNFLEPRGVELRGTVVIIGEVPRTGMPIDSLTGPERLFSDKYAHGRGFSYDGRHAWMRLTPTHVTS